MATTSKKTSKKQTAVTVAEPKFHTVEFSVEHTVELITQDYAQAIGGAKAFVRMGLRLVILKNNCSHGEFKPLLEKHFPSCSKSMLYNAKKSAENILEDNGYEVKGVLDLDSDEIDDLSDQATGKSRRMLIGGKKADPESEPEQRYKALVMPVLESSPELMEEWIERIETGETSWYLAWQALVNGPGNKTDDTEGSWYESPHVYIGKGLKSAAKWGVKVDWNDVPEDDKAEIQHLLGEFLANLPPTLSKYALSILTTHAKQA